MISVVIAAIVAAIPISYFAGLVPITVYSDGLSPVFEEAELMERNERVVHGTIVDLDTSVVFPDGGNNMKTPYVFSIWTLEVEDAVKGIEEQTIQFKTSGGTYRNIVHHSESPSFELGEEVIVFLTKDPDSVWGDSYYLTGIESGVFKIDPNGNARNELRDIAINAEQFKNTLRSIEP
jgi:hypothetical protein